MTWKLFTFSLFIFTIYSKIPFLPSEVLWTPKIQNLYISMGWMGVLFPAFSFQVVTQYSSDVQSVFFKSQLPHLWDFTPAFVMIYPRIYDEVVQYRLNHHGYCFEFVSDADWSISQPRIQNFQARKIIVSSRENFMLNTRIHFILYENEVYSRKEWSVFS